MKACPDCGKPFKRDASWCSSCACKRNMFYEKTCPECGKLITDQATHCGSCARKELFVPFYRTCDWCGEDFLSIPSRETKSGIYFCCQGCQAEYFKIPCDNCGQRFTPDHRNRGIFHTCSMECRNEMLSKRATGKRRSDWITLSCENCGKIFERMPSRVKSEYQFCSYKCKADWARGTNHHMYTSIDCVCEICGREFVRTRVRVLKHGGKYCSRVCFSQSQILPRQDYYGPNWLKQRAKARKRDSYICQICGEKEETYGRALDVHHIIPFRDFGLDRYREANDLSNLITLCKKCHRTIENGVPITQVLLDIAP